MMHRLPLLGLALSALALLPAAAAAARIRQTWAKGSLQSGKASPRIEATTAVFAAIRPGESLTLVHTATGEILGAFTPLAEDGLQALALELPNHAETACEVRAGDTVLDARTFKIDSFPYTADSEVQNSVPQGTLIRRTGDQSTIFPGTVRDFIIYVPAQYGPTRPACLMVFQDGIRHATGPLRAPTVLDNLIHQGDMPVTIGLFIDPDRAASQKPGDKARNRGFEYDSLGDAYVRFLLEEINAFGNWPLANRQMEAALRFMGYDYRYLWGPCMHGSAHAAAALPEMLRWFWRDTPA